jgi:hypothetical protein
VQLDSRLGRQAHSKAVVGILALLDGKRCTAELLAGMWVATS